MIRARGNAFQVVVYLGRRDGKDRYARATAPTLAAAKKAETALKAKRDAGRRVTAANVTVAELLDRYLEHVGPRLSPTTRTGYESCITQTIVPELGALKLAQLTAERLDRFYSQLAVAAPATKARAAKKKRGLSAQSVRHVHAVLRQACNVAIRWDLLDVNPTANARPPTVARDPRRPPDPATLKAFIAELDDELAVLVRLAAVTGARRGEYLALRWSDVDLEHQAVTIEHALIGRPAGEVLYKSTKTRSGERDVALDAATVAALEQHLEAERAKAAWTHTPFDPAGYVFTLEPGQPWHPDIATGRFRRAAKKHGLAAHLHDLRHWAATYGTAAGFSARQVADRLGHSDATLVHNRYGHSIPDADRALAGSLGALLD